MHFRFFDSGSFEEGGAVSRNVCDRYELCYCYLWSNFSLILVTMKYVPLGL